MWNINIEVLGLVGGSSSTQVSKPFGRKTPFPAHTCGHWDV